MLTLKAEGVHMAIIHEMRKTRTGSSSFAALPRRHSPATLLNFALGPAAPARATAPQ